jgi:hypothetical protein
MALGESSPRSTWSPGTLSLREPRLANVKLKMKKPAKFKLKIKGQMPMASVMQMTKPPKIF